MRNTTTTVTQNWDAGDRLRLATIAVMPGAGGQEQVVEHRAAAEPLLAVSGLRVEFPTRHGTLRAVHDVSFDIAPGEMLGVVGESGAGKSLTGAAIIGLIDPPGRIAGGEIRLAGRRIDNLPYDAMRASAAARSARSSRIR